MATDKIKKLEKQLETLRTKPDKGASGRKKVYILNELAQVLFFSDIEKAKDCAQQALRLAERLKCVDETAKSFLNIGRYYTEKTKYYRALELYSKSLNIFEKSKNKQGVAKCYNYIANLYYAQCIYDKALEYYYKSLKIDERMGNKEGIAVSYSNIGVIYYRQGDYDFALEYAVKSLKIRRGIKDKSGVASSCTNIANIHLSQQAYDQALQYHRKSLKIYREIGNKSEAGFSYLNIGVVYVEQHNHRRALVSYLKANEIFKEIGSRQGEAATCINIGEVYVRLKKYDTAFEYLRHGLKLSKNIKNKRYQMCAYGTLCELYEAQHDYKNAFIYNGKRTAIDRALLNVEKARSINQMRIRYETEEKEKEAKIYRLKNVDLRREIIKRKKAEKELQEHRDQLEELVAERTLKLEKEIVERKQAEQTLLNNQKQLRSLAREISLIEEKQRRKFATFLHDDINQALALATFKLRSIQESKSRKNTRKEIGKVKAIIDKTAERTRQLAFEISPPILYELGLEPALEWLVRQFGEQYGIKHKFNDDGLQKPITDDASVFLFQSVRELLSNVAKHAQAKSVTVSAVRDGRSIRIAVEDDGIGFSPKSLERKIRQNEGFGLFNIRERLRHLHGRMETQSKRGQGTTMTLIAPLKRAARKKVRK